MGFTRKSFAIELSKLKVFEKPKVQLEQYPTDSEVAADFLWDAAIKNEILEKTVADFGCGTGILGIGCLLLGAKKVVFVDKDNDALDIARQNYEKIKIEYDLSSAEAEFILSEINDFKGSTDLVVENPPFGIKDAHADKIFLGVAFNSAPLLYSLHKTESKKFIESIAKDNNFRILEIKNYNFPLKQTMHYHTKKIQRIPVSCFKMQKI